MQNFLTPMKGSALIVLGKLMLTKKFGTSPRFYGTCLIFIQNQCSNTMNIKKVILTLLVNIMYMHFTSIIFDID